MRLLLAIILPWLQFFTIGRPIAGIICLVLQITLIGWIPAAIWSVYALVSTRPIGRSNRRWAGGVEV
nr:YqaE/Pmp3 family membrane protein [Candidatus Burkholderia verschuerenii]